MPMVKEDCGVLTSIGGRSEKMKWDENQSSTHTIPMAAALAIVMIGVGAHLRPCGELAVVACCWLFVV
jgi:hypothetical protein